MILDFLDFEGRERSRYTGGSSNSRRELGTGSPADPTLQEAQGCTNNIYTLIKKHILYLRKSLGTLVYIGTASM